MTNRISVAELRAQAMAARNITPQALPDPFGEIIREDPVTGRLEAHYPTPAHQRPVQVIGFGMLDALPNLRRPLAEASALHGCSVKRPQTRERIVSSLRLGFAAFAVATKRSGLGIGDITSGTLAAFKQWLDEHRARQGEPLSEPTRHLLLMDFQILLRRLRASQTWRSRLDPKLELMVNPYPGVSQKHKPTNPLTDDELEKVFNTASREAVIHMSATIALLDEMDVAPGLAEWGTTEPTIAHAANTLWETYGVELPDFKALQKNRPDLADVLRKDYGRVRSTLVPSLRSIAPYAILFALYFRYNHSTLFGAKRKDFAIRSFLGKERVVASAFKPRARRRQYAALPATDDPDNPAVLLRFMDRWTRRARSRAPRHSRRHLFIAGATKKNGWVRNLERVPSPKIFEYFCAKYDLPELGMRILRATGLDVVHDIFRGDILAMMAAGGQRNAGTLVSHYSNGGVRMRNEEAIGQAMVLKERWEKSGGLIDPRSNRGDDRAAATPGFICLDPFAEPMDRRSDAQTCSAYGMCPACKFAVVRRDSGYSYAQCLLLEEAIERSIDDPASLARWGPALDRLRHYWLLSFTDAARRSALESYSDLPTLPKVS